MNTDVSSLKSNERTKSFARDGILILAFTMAMVVAAHMRISFFAIPFTLQSFVVVFSAFVIGHRKAALSYVLYLLYGIGGAAVFAYGGGIGYIFSPTFGYIVGFIAMAYVIGICIEKEGKQNLTFTKLILFAIIGTLIQLSMGVAYFYMISNLALNVPITLASATYYGAIIFLIPDFIKILVAAIIASQIIKRV